MPSLMRGSQSDNALASASLSEINAETSQVDGPSFFAETSGVRRSSSADSALNKAASKRSKANTRNHSIIYEIDSEEEEQMLAEAQAAIEQYHANDTNGELNFDAESYAEFEEGSARSRAVQKKKSTTSTTTTTTRGRGKTPVTNDPVASKTVNTRGRKKLRKDSETMDVDID